MNLQKKYFQSEFSRLEKGKYVNLNSPLAKLDPYLDEHKIVRVGGRLNNAEDLNYELKNPIILPKFSLITDAIVMSCHEKVTHGGRSATLNQMRTEGYWVIEANSKVRFLLRKSFECRRKRGKFGSQKLAPLPKDRTENVAPFTYVCCDFFGPYMVKEGRKELKRYGCIFSDLVYRGIHTELCRTLETDTFINALRCLIARRGPIRLLRCDNGSNFVGANNEIRKAIENMDDKKIRDFLLKHGCDFTFKHNTPLSSHHGGVWERLIRVIRQNLDTLLYKEPTVLTEDSLRTLLIEVEGIINSRPLAVDCLSDPESPVPLTPLNLLTQKSKVVLPPFGDFDGDDAKYSKKQWSRVQHFANKYWARFRKEYLMTLQNRNKWSRPEPNFQVGDIVLLKEDALCRNDWPVSKIIEVFPGTDGLVRSVRLRLPRSDLRSNIKTLERPVIKLVLLAGVDEIDSVTDSAQKSNA